MTAYYFAVEHRKSWNLADKAQAELKQDTDVLSGNIAIGCGEMRSAQEIAKLITDFQNIYPFVQFELYKRKQRKY